MQRLQALHGILIDDDVGGGDNEFSLVRTEQRPVTPRNRGTCMLMTCPFFPWRQSLIPIAWTL